MPEKKEHSWEQKFEEKMKKLEAKIEDIGRHVEKKGEEVGKKVEVKAKAIHEEIDKRGGKRHNMFWGFIFIVVGILWLGSNMDWFDGRAVWLPIVMIAGGIYIVFKHWKKKESNDEEGSV